MAHVLLIDDQPEIRTLLRAIVEREGHTATMASDPAAAWAALAHKPDLMFVDIHLPKQSGVDMVARMRTYPQFASVPVVLITAHHDEGRVALQRTDLGPVDLVCKPFRFEAIAEVMRKYLPASAP